VPIADTPTQNTADEAAAPQGAGTGDTQSAPPPPTPKRRKPKPASSDTTDATNGPAPQYIPMKHFDDSAMQQSSAVAATPTPYGQGVFNAAP
jgi:hypothetical protein